MQQDELRSGLCGLIQAKEAFHSARAIQQMVEDVKAAETLTGCIVKELTKNMTEKLSLFRIAVDSLPDKKELKALLFHGLEG